MTKVPPGPMRRPIVPPGAFVVLVLSLGLATGLPTSRGANDGPWLTASTTVVLFPGLPGDIASEINFRIQLRAWLDWLDAAEPRPGRVVVAWEETPDGKAEVVTKSEGRSEGRPSRQSEGIADGKAEVVTKSEGRSEGPPSRQLGFPVPASLKVEVITPRRDAFLGLAERLAEAPRLLVVLWGHGGLQGNQPVFHVRGPRLRPDDVRSVAGRWTGRETRWVLFFRGSARFARALAGPGREIVASEHERTWSNDPVGLPILLECLRTAPGGSFAEAADALGPRLAAWYEERNLVCTEDPALWLGEAPPRRLMSSAPVTLSAGRTAGGGAATATSPPVLEAAAAAERTPEVPAPEWPAGWADLKLVDAQQHPGAKAVVLRQVRKVTLAGDPALSIEHERFIQILTEEGKREGDFEMRWAPPDEDLTVLAAEVRRPDGTLATVRTEEVRHTTVPAAGDYASQRQTYFSLPGVVPGAVVHLHYRVEWRRFPLPHVSLSLPLAESVPALESSIEVTLPREAAFHFGFEAMPSSDPVVRQTAYGTAYRWQWTGLPASPTEALVPPETRPALLVSTFPDWKAFAAWYERISQPAEAPAPEVAEKARELTRTATNDTEKVRALYHYVSGLRYVAVPIGLRSFRPRAAAETLRNQFGDCKDKANLLNALARSLGFEAHLVLVPRFGHAYETLPGLAFNHALSRVTLDGQPCWMDTTDEVCRFGLLPPGNAGRRVLVVGETNAMLTSLPLAPAGAHRLVVQTRLVCGSNAAPARLSVVARATGIVDYQLRLGSRALAEADRNLPLLSGQYRLSNGAFVLTRQQSTAVSDLDRDFEWQAEGQMAGLVSADGQESCVRPGFWLPQEWDAALHARTQPLWLNLGHPLTLEQELELGLPAGTVCRGCPAGQDQPAPPLRWQLTWSREGERHLRARLRVEATAGELSAAEVPVFQEQLLALHTALAGAAHWVTQP